ncbi:unnamed protein product [Phaeothamnion confervicola]
MQDVEINQLQPSPAGGGPAGGGPAGGGPAAAASLAPSPSPPPPTGLGAPAGGVPMKVDANMPAGLDANKVALLTEMQQVAELCIDWMLAAARAAAKKSVEKARPGPGVKKRGKDQEEDVTVVKPLIWPEELYRMVQEYILPSATETAELAMWLASSFTPCLRALLVSLRSLTGPPWRPFA